MQDTIYYICLYIALIVDYVFSLFHCEQLSVLYSGRGMIVTAVTIFSITYAGIAFGRIPGLKVDRTSIALLGLAVSSNIGSAATIIGNPQNMLIGKVGNLSFGRFFFWCAPPALVSLLLSYLLICRMYRTAFHIHTASSPFREKNCLARTEPVAEHQGTVCRFHTRGIVFYRYPP